MTPTQALVRIITTLSALTAFCAVMWFAWLGWDHQYYLVDGVPQGPYRPWQVTGCGLSVAVAAAAAYRFLRMPFAIGPIVLAADIGFAIPWAVDASSSDETGLWAVGLIMLLVGGAIGLTFVVGLTAILTPRRPSVP
ncbi:MAG: hypothetical protein ACJ72L_00505 [Marmoricola sp.]